MKAITWPANGTLQVDSVLCDLPPTIGPEAMLVLDSSGGRTMAKRKIFSPEQIILNLHTAIVLTPSQLQPVRLLYELVHLLGAGQVTVGSVT